MDNEPKNIAVADLCLSVYSRVLHPEFFAIRARRTFDGAAFDGEIWLLNPGHVITYREDDRAVTEVMGPRELELPARGRMRRIELSAGREQRIETRGPMVYHVAYQVDTEKPDTYRLEAEDLLAGSRQGHLFVEDPGELARRAFSYAVPDPRAHGLLVHTWHGFPDECTIVKTQTLIERVNL